MILKLQKFKGTTAQYIILFFALLPVIDTLNGIMHSIPIGLLYKGFLCILLFFNILMRKVRIQQKFVKIFAGSIAYMFFGITCNIILNGSLISMDFPVKLLFNIALMCLLGCNLENGYLSANAIFEILDKSSWIFLPCFLIPYVLGVGNQVYGSEMGYKAFFVSQNELSLVIVVMIFFAAYKLSLHLDFIGIFKIALLFLCGMILNTKSTIIACLIAVFTWGISVILKESIRIKLISIVAFCGGVFIFKDKVIIAASRSIGRMLWLQSNYYQNSMISGILSNRNSFAQSAWETLHNKHTFFRIIFGNGFCSDILVEMDIVDIFFYLGIIGAIFTIIFLLYVLKRSISNAKKDGTIIRPVSFIIIIGFLSITGHVLFMAMSGCYFVIYCCFLIYYKNNIQIYRKR